MLVTLEFSARIFFFLIETFKAEFEHTVQPCPGSVAHILAYCIWWSQAGWAEPHACHWCLYHVDNGLSRWNTMSRCALMTFLWSTVGEQIETLLLAVQHLGQGMRGNSPPTTLQDIILWWMCEIQANKICFVWQALLVSSQRGFRITKPTDHSHGTFSNCNLVLWSSAHKNSAHLKQVLGRENHVIRFLCALYPSHWVGPK